jgi:hypothetical protein
MNWVRETAHAEELGSFDETRLARSPGQAGLHANTRSQGYAALRDGQYAVSRRDAQGTLPASADGAYFEWWYASFHRWQPDHFVEPDFGRRQVFALAHVNGSTPSIRFCSRVQGHPYVAGVLSLSADTSISEAAWRFHTPRANEGAGGHAWYLSPATKQVSQRYLLPTAAVFWRRRGGDNKLFFHDSAVYRGWYFGLSPDIPSLPEHTGSGSPPDPPRS